MFEIEYLYNFMTMIFDYSNWLVSRDVQLASIPLRPLISARS